MINPTIPTRALPLIWRRLSVATGIAGVVLLLYTLVLDYRYFDQVPRKPIPENGNVYPYNMHGVVLYETQQEMQHYQFFEIAGGGLMIGAAISEHFRKKVYGK